MIKFYGKEFKYLNEIPEVSEEEIHIFSSQETKKNMIMRMEDDLTIPLKINKAEVAKIFTQFSLLKSMNDWKIIAGQGEMSLVYK